jgi:hypothetical protein
MKITRSQLKKILKEEISKMLEEAYYRKYTPGGSEHRDLDPRQGRRRRRRRSIPRPLELPPEPGPGDPNYDQGKEDALAQRDNFDHTTATWKPGTSDNTQPNRPQPRSTPEDRAYMKGYMHYLYRKDLDETMQESFRFMSKNQIQAQINQAEDDGEDDGSLLAYYPEDMTANEAGNFMYGNSPDPKYWGDAIRVHPDAVKAYWARRKEVYDHLKAKQ